MSMESIGFASFGLEMSEIGRAKCKNVISEIETIIKEQGNTITPLLADIFNRNKNSSYMISLTGLRLLNFENISQHLDGNGHKTLNDFVKEVQSMLKGVADEFGLSSEVISEVEFIHDIFFSIMENTFEDIDFSKARSVMEFSSGRPTIALLSREARVAQSKGRRSIKKSMTRSTGCNANSSSANIGLGLVLSPVKAMETGPSGNQQDTVADITFQRDMKRDEAVGCAKPVKKRGQERVAKAVN